MKSWLTIFFLACLSLSAPAWADDDGDDNTGSDDTQVHHLYDGVDMVSAIKFQYGKQHVVIKSVFPQLESSDDNEASPLSITLLMASYKMKSIISAILFPKNATHQQALSSGTTKNNLYIDYNASVIRWATIISLAYDLVCKAI